VLTARKLGLIPSAGQVIQALIDIGFRIDEGIIKEALAQTVGEKWPP
jgi:predicted nucleic acid-binding protein